MPTIVKQIEGVEEEVQHSKKRLDTIERRLRLCALGEKERANLEDEELKLKTSLEKNYAELRSLRFENFKTMILSVVVMLFLYGLYYIFSSHQTTDTTS